MKSHVAEHGAAEFYTASTRPMMSLSIGTTVARELQTDVESATISDVLGHCDKRVEIL